MPRAVLVIFFAIFLLGLTTTTTIAVVDPLATPNNKYGIHIVDENDLESAAALVNSNGGQWGYVTVVIREDDRNIDKWQKTFDRMRKLKLIPLVRIATVSRRGVWLTPSEEDLDSWVYFLNSLNWVVQNRYVIIFNEPNHAQEWGGQIDPTTYTKILRSLRNKLKEASPDFFVLPAGLDAAAGNTKSTMEMSQFLTTMHQADERIFADLDGWTSHSYPNPGFSGKPTDTGRATIKSYLWETNFLQKYGLRENIPVFITETGWMWDGNLKTLNTISENYKRAFSDIWKEAKIVAVTPFILNYQAPPFDKFSWTRKGTSEFYPQYSVVAALPKIAGKPSQIFKAEFIQDSLPGKLIVDSEYTLALKFKNTGQEIWSGDVEVAAGGGLTRDRQVVGSLKAEPGEEAKVFLTFKTPVEAKPQEISLTIFKDGRPIGDTFVKEVELLSPPGLVLKAGLGFATRASGKDFAVDLFEGNSQIQFNDIAFKDGVAEIKELHSVIPGRQYTFVLKKPYFLPKARQTQLSGQRTIVNFGRLLPFDMNNDQKFTVEDILAGLTNPTKFIRLLTGG